MNGMYCMVKLAKEGADMVAPRYNYEDVPYYDMMDPNAPVALGR